MSGSLVNDEKPMFHGITRGAFQLNYKTEKFSWGTRLDGKWEPKTTDNARLSYKNERVGIIYKAATTQPLTIGVKSDFAWTPSKEVNYATWLLYQYRNDRAYNHTLNYDGSTEEDERFSYYNEVPVMDEHKIETGLKTLHSFNSGHQVLHSSFSFQAITSQRVNTWTVFKTDPSDDGSGSVIDTGEVSGYAWRYRITPSSTDLNIDGDIHLQNKIFEEGRLTVTPGLRFSSKQALDHNSGATQASISLDGETEQWRDSTRLREFFDFLSIRAEHYLLADLIWKNIDVHFDYALQVYGRRLNDDEHRQPFKIKGLYPVGKANVRWVITPQHSLNLSNQMSVSHPDYLKVCWYDRTAGYMDQLYRGNEQLISPQTMVYSLDYEFKWRGFVSKTTVSYKDVINEIDQTWTNEEIEGRTYKVFHWLNSADSRSVGIAEALGWRGKYITANLGLTYNQSSRTAKTSGNIKNSFDWKLTADVSARLGKGWSVGVDAKYQSKVATFFTIFKEYCELNARIQKDFKHFSLFLEGRDLLDMPRETSFESEDQKELWVEEVRSNRRIFILGGKWNF